MAKQNTHTLLTDNHRNQISRDCPLEERLTETILSDGNEMGESREKPAMLELLSNPVCCTQAIMWQRQRESLPRIGLVNTLNCINTMGEMRFCQTTVRYILRAL